MAVAPITGLDDCRPLRLLWHCSFRQSRGGGQHPRLLPFVDAAFQASRSNSLPKEADFQSDALPRSVSATRTTPGQHAGIARLLPFSVLTVLIHVDDD